MRVFGREAAEIVPHAGDDARDLGFKKLGKARLMLRLECLETPRKGPMRRASAPPRVEALSSGKTLNPPSKDAAPQASRRSANRGALAVMLGQVAAIAVG